MIDIIPGIGPEPLEGAGTISASLNLFCEVYVSPVLDLTKTISDVELIPAKQGYFPLALNQYFVVVSRSGTQVTPATIKAGNNTNKTNFLCIFSGVPIPSTIPINTDVNNANPPCITNNNGNSAFTPVTSPIPGRPVLMDVVTPASGTGGFSAMVRMIAFVGWVAVNP